MKKHIVVILLLMLPIIGFSQYNQYEPKDTTKQQYPYRLPMLCPIDVILLSSNIDDGISSTSFFTVD